MLQIHPYGPFYIQIAHRAHRAAGRTVNASRKGGADLLLHLLCKLLRHFSYHFPCHLKNRPLHHGFQLQNHFQEFSVGLHAL